MQRQTCRDKLPAPRSHRWLRSILIVSLVASLTTIPTASSAQTIGSTDPTTYRDVVISVEGHEPQTIWSGEVSSYSESHINELVDEFLQLHGNGASGSTANSAASSVGREVVTCDRTTDVNFHSYPYREVIGEAYAVCFGQFRWVELTGSLRLQRSWQTDRVLDEDTDTAYFLWESMNATPDALCDGTSTSAFRARNEVEITFNSGATLRLRPRRETPWHWYRCSV